MLHNCDEPITQAPCTQSLRMRCTNEMTSLSDTILQPPMIHVSLSIGLPANRTNRRLAISKDARIWTI